jgi:hypothetical protein
MQSPVSLVSHEHVSVESRRNYAASNMVGLISKRTQSLNRASGEGIAG